MLDQWSRIDRGLMLLSVFVITEVTSFLQIVFESSVPLQHSSIHYNIKLTVFWVVRKGGYARTRTRTQAILKYTFAFI